MSFRTATASCTLFSFLRPLSIFCDPGLSALSVTPRERLSPDKVDATHSPAFSTTLHSSPSWQVEFVTFTIAPVAAVAAANASSHTSETANPTPVTRQGLHPAAPLKVVAFVDEALPLLVATEQDEAALHLAAVEARQSQNRKMFRTASVDSTGQRETASRSSTVDTGIPTQHRTQQTLNPRLQHLHHQTSVTSSLQKHLRGYQGPARTHISPQPPARSLPSKRITE